MASSFVNGKVGWLLLLWLYPFLFLFLFFLAFPPEFIIIDGCFFFFSFLFLVAFYRVPSIPS